MARRLLGAHALLVYVFLYAPIVVVVVYAFNGSRQALNWGGFSLVWFGRALHDSTITGPLRLSLEIALGNAVVASILGTALALCLSRMRSFVRLPFETVVYMTLVTPEIVFGISALIFFTSFLHVQLGWATILVSHVVFNTSVVALIVRARFLGMGHTQEEASFDLGAGPIRTFLEVTLPRLAPAIFAGALLSFTFSFDDFYTSFFVAGAGSTTLPLRIFASLRFGVSPIVNATATMMLALTLTATVVAYVVLRRTSRGAPPAL